MNNIYFPVNLFIKNTSISSIKIDNSYSIPFIILPLSFWHIINASVYVFIDSYFLFRNYLCLLHSLFCVTTFTVATYFIFILTLYKFVYAYCLFIQVCESPIISVSVFCFQSEHIIELQYCFFEQLVPAFNWVTVLLLWLLGKFEASLMFSYVDFKFSILMILGVFLKKFLHFKDEVGYGQDMGQFLLLSPECLVL